VASIKDKRFSKGNFSAKELQDYFLEYLCVEIVTPKEEDTNDIIDSTT